jgi:hypothetical protein
MYTFTANEIVVAGSAVRQACGGDRRMVYLRHPVQETTPVSGGKVIDFNAWRAAQEEEKSISAYEDEPAFDVEDDFEEFLPQEEELQESVPSTTRRPRSHQVRRARRGMYLDWMVSAALIAVSITLCISFLL